MDTKALLYGLIGFFIGGLLVSVAATTFDKPQSDMNEMTSMLESKTGDEFDSAFIDSMIEHHQAAIDMAMLADKSAKHDEIKVLANEIMSAQSKEIDMMQSWQSDWGYKSTPTSHDTMSH